MITLNKECLKTIIAHCKKEFPNEACGILAGKEGKVKKIFEMENTDKSPSSYFMDSKQQLEVMKQMRSLGLDMVGIYHSHIASAAYPSSHDIELAFYEDASYVIISLKDMDKPNVRSFKIKEGKIEEEKVSIV